MKTLIKSRLVIVSAIVLFLPAMILHAQDYSVRIAFIGNSITFGAGTTNPSTRSYPVQLGILLSEVYGDTCVIGNFGVSSRVMLKNGDFPIWEDPEFDQALAFKPNIVVFALGTNDSKTHNWDNYGDEFYADYMSMVDTFKQVNPFVEIFVCHPPPAFDIVWGIRDSVIVNGVIPVVDQVIAETGVELINFYNPLLDSVHLFPDYIHPNDKGAAAMADIVNARFEESNVIREAERGLSFITTCESDKMYITKNDSLGLLSWTTINATNVYLDGDEVEINGSKEVDHLQGTTHTLVAAGEKNSDTLEYNFILYEQVVTDLSLSASEKSFYTEDTITLSTTYMDQYGYPVSDTVLEIQWSISLGKGFLFGQKDNLVFFTSPEASTTVISASHKEMKKGITLKIAERDHTFIENNTNGPLFETFPNPFDNHISFRFTEDESIEGSLKIIDMQGKICIHEKMGPDERGLYSLDTKQLAEGIYFYELNRGKNVFTGKLVKGFATTPKR